MKNFYLIFMLLLCETIVAQGVVNSEKLFTSDVDKFSLIFSPSIDLQKGNSDVLESGIQAKSGILIKGGNTLEEFAKVKNIVFDKTSNKTHSK